MTTQIKTYVQRFIVALSIMTERLDIISKKGQLNHGTLIAILFVKEFYFKNLMTLIKKKGRDNVWRREKVGFKTAALQPVLRIVHS